MDDPLVVRTVRSDGGERVFWLVDLAADAADPPFAAAIATPATWSTTDAMELGEVVVGEGDARRFGWRLLTGVADLLRADGASRVVATAPASDLSYQALLEGAGFRRCIAGSGRDDGVVWFDQEL